METVDLICRSRSRCIAGCAACIGDEGRVRGTHHRACITNTELIGCRGGVAVLVVADTRDRNGIGRCRGLPGLGAGHTTDRDAIAQRAGIATDSGLLAQVKIARAIA